MSAAEFRRHGHAVIDWIAEYLEAPAIRTSQSAGSPKNIGALMQGVTTVVTGADGRGPLDVARVMAASERLGLGTNTYALAGFGTVRERVMGSSSAPASPEQIATMRA